MKIIKLIKSTFNKKDIDFLIFFITAKCNSKCSHCFYWKNINKKDDLKLDEIKKISYSLPKIKDLSLSGGEPLLREDLIEICKTFYANNNISSLSIPTNGLLPEKLYETTKTILKECPNLKLLINFSLDGLEKTHDSIRGVKGNFNKVKLSIEKLSELNNNNLYININTVISSQNYKELPELMEYVRANLDVDGHYFEILRGSPKNSSLNLPPLEEIKRLHELSLKNDEYYFYKKYSKLKLKITKPITKLFFIGIVKYMYRTQENFLKNKRWPFRCLAGQTSLVIEHNGDLKICELLPTVLNLKEFDFNVKSAISSEKYKNALLNTKNCYCTHNCFIYNSINHNPCVRFFKVPMLYLLKKK